MNVYVLFLSQFVIQSIYCSFAYTSFKSSPYFVYCAMLSGLMSQYIWAQILKSSETHTIATVSGVFFDSITFLIWASVPLVFFNSSFNKIGILGVLLVVAGMCLVGLQDILVK